MNKHKGAFIGTAAGGVVGYVYAAHFAKSSKVGTWAVIGCIVTGLAVGHYIDHKRNPTLLGEISLAPKAVETARTQS